MTARCGFALVLAVATVSGCAESLPPASDPSGFAIFEPVAPTPQPTSQPPPSAVVAQAEPQEPPEEPLPAPRPRARSISLGFTGDGVLSGGVTRDTPMEPRPPTDPYSFQNWQGYVNAPNWRSAQPRFPVYGHNGYGYGAGIVGMPMTCACPCAAARAGDY